MQLVNPPYIYVFVDVFLTGASCALLSGGDIVFNRPCNRHVVSPNVVAEILLKNRTGVLPHGLFFTIVCMCRYSVETLVGTFSGVFLCRGDDVVAIRGATFDDADKINGDALYGQGGHVCTLSGVERYNNTDSSRDSTATNGLHFLSDQGKVTPDIQRRQRAARDSMSLAGG